MIGKSGLLARAVCAVDQKSGIIIVHETWDTSAADCPFVSARRGAVMPNPLVRQIYMHRREAEQLNLLPRSN